MTSTMTLIFEVGMFLILIISLLMLEYHIYKVFEEPTLSKLDTLLVIIVGITCMHNSIENGLTGSDLAVSMFPPILAFIASACAILVEKLLEIF